MKVMSQKAQGALVWYYPHTGTWVLVQRNGQKTVFDRAFADVSFNFLGIPSGKSMTFYRDRHEVKQIMS